MEGRDATYRQAGRMKERNGMRSAKTGRGWSRNTADGGETARVLAGTLFLWVTCVLCLLFGMRYCTKGMVYG